MPQVIVGLRRPRTFDAPSGTPVFAGKFCRGLAGTAVRPRRVNAQAQQALDERKRTFGGSGLFAALRNHHVFHFPSDEVVEEAFQRLPDADKWEFFISHMVANSYYHLSEMIVGLAMMRGVDQDDPAAGFEKIGALTIKVADKFRDFFGECIAPSWRSALRANQTNCRWLR
jgi:hypothetical protein